MDLFVPLAEGFEEIEAITIIDVLRRADINVITVSLNEKKVKGAHGIEVIAEESLEVLADRDFAGIILPGGMPGAENLKNNKRLIKIIKELFANKKLIGAICAAPIVLQEAGIIKNKDITSYPGFDKELFNCNYKTERVVRDDNIITSRGPGVALEFSISIVEYLKDEEIARKLMENMITNFNRF
ncbi:MAG: DJ-1 family glyoxalase III [bacterium]